MKNDISIEDQEGWVSRSAQDTQFAALGKVSFNHTFTPAERAYFDPDWKLRQLVWIGIFAIYAVIGIGGYFWIFGA